MKKILTLIAFLVVVVSVHQFSVVRAQFDVFAPEQGGTGTSTTPTHNQVLLGHPSSGIYNLSAIPDCTGSNKLLFNSSTQAFSCSIDNAGSGGVATSSPFTAGLIPFVLNPNTITATTSFSIVSSTGEITSNGRIILGDQTTNKGDLLFNSGSLAAGVNQSEWTFDATRGYALFQDTSQLFFATTTNRSFLGTYDYGETVENLNAALTLSPDSTSGLYGLAVRDTLGTQNIFTTSDTGTEVVGIASSTEQRTPSSTIDRLRSVEVYPNTDLSGNVGSSTNRWAGVYSQLFTAGATTTLIRSDIANSATAVGMRSMWNAAVATPTEGARIAEWGYLDASGAYVDVVGLERRSGLLPGWALRRTTTTESIQIHAGNEPGTTDVEGARFTITPRLSAGNAAFTFEAGDKTLRLSENSGIQVFGGMGFTTDGGNSLNFASFQVAGGYGFSFVGSTLATTDPLVQFGSSATIVNRADAGIITNDGKWLSGGAGYSTTIPKDGFFGAQGMRRNFGTNNIGANTIIASGPGTGANTSSSAIIFRTTTSTVSGATLQTLRNRMILHQNGSLLIQDDASTSTIPTALLQITGSAKQSQTNLFSIASSSGSTFFGVASSGIPMFLGTSTASIGGGALLAGQCATGATIIPLQLSTTTDVINATAQIYPGAGIAPPFAYIDKTGATSSITVAVCAEIAATPTSSPYNLTIQRMTGL